MNILQVNRGLGVLFILSSKGLLGKNQFEDFTVSLALSIIYLLETQSQLHD